MGGHTTPTETQSAKAVIKAIGQLSFDPDMFAYSFTQGSVGADAAMQLRMADLMIAIGRVWAGWHASGYSKDSPLAGVCEQAYVIFTNAGMEI